MQLAEIMRGPANSREKEGIAQPVQPISSQGQGEEGRARGRDGRPIGTSYEMVSRHARITCSFDRLASLLPLAGVSNARLDSSPRGHFVSSYRVHFFDDAVSEEPSSLSFRSSIA